MLTVHVSLTSAVCIVVPQYLINYWCLINIFQLYQDMVGNRPKCDTIPIRCGLYVLRDPSQLPHYVEFLFRFARHVICSVDIYLNLISERFGRFIWFDVINPPYIKNI